jgi:tight adherence protein C
MTSIAPTLGAATAAAGVAVAGTVARQLVTRPARHPAALPGRPVGAGSPRPDRLWSRGRRRPLAVAGFLTIVAVAGVPAAGSVIAAAVLVRHVAPLRSARQQRSTIERMLPEAMELLVLSVRAGLTPFQAVCDLATFDEPAVGDAFAEVVRRTQRGHTFADALAALPERLGPSAGGLADVIATSDRHGLPLGPMLDQLAAEVRATRRRLDQADARKLPVRLSFPLVACTLPSFVLLAIAPAVIAALSSLGGTAW